MKPDGNVAFKVTWVYGKKGPFTSPCTVEGRVINIQKAHKIWCSDKTCHCRILLNRGSTAAPKVSPCYDSVVFRDWEFGLGVIRTSKTRRNQPLMARFIRPGKLAFLTSKEHGTPEEDRLVIGVYKIAELAEDDPDLGHMVRSVHGTGVRVKNLTAAPKYWRYHKQSSGPRWGCGLFRYLPDKEAAKLYAAVVEAAKR